MKKPAKGTGQRAAPKSNKAGPVTAQKKVASLQFSLRSAGAQPIQVHQLDSPLRYERRDRIQPRRILPRVIEGRERDFHSVSPQIDPRPTSTCSVEIMCKWE